jgi:membrane protease YdiL (CAAX protease family)
MRHELAPLLLFAGVIAYYAVCVRLVGEPLARVARSILSRSALGRRRSWSDLDCVTRLVLAGLMQAVFIVLLLALTSIGWRDLSPARRDVGLVLLGVLLGIGEAGLATQMAMLATRFADLARPDDSPATVEGWLSAARGGWIRYYLRTAASAPIWILVLATVLYVSGEEIVFRGIVLTQLSPTGAPQAVLLSTALFAVVQTFYTPGWTTALFPVTGAIVVGIVHGTLFTITPDILPLAVAHATMFLFTVL